MNEEPTKLKKKNIMKKFYKTDERSSWLEYDDCDQFLQP